MVSGDVMEKVNDHVKWFHSKYWKYRCSHEEYYLYVDGECKGEILRISKRPVEWTAWSSKDDQEYFNRITDAKKYLYERVGVVV